VSLWVRYFFITVRLGGPPPPPPPPPKNPYLPICFVIPHLTVPPLKGKIGRS
jgi:hypothetical protein